MKAPTRDKLSSVILWSIISAAFIGPGTVTTAASAGSQFQLQLLWAVTFATLACIALQEVSARITISSGLSFGQALDKKFGHQKGFWVKWLVGGSVVLGCAAYEAGNILGGTSGLILLLGDYSKTFTIVLTLIAALILWSGRGKWISTIMTILVAMMGIAFFALAFYGNFSFGEVVSSSMVPVIPPGAELLTLGLVGTTIVPYNIFLGSGISKGQTIPLMRVGLSISVIIGGLITAWILMAGTLASEFNSFADLSNQFQTKIGMIGVVALGVGLFAAGFSSAITSPYAASIIATSVFDTQKKNIVWVWGSVLAVGFLFGISGIKPIPVILAVQAVNGLILPLITYFLIVIVNDPFLIPVSGRHASWYNAVLILILGCVLVLGFNNIDKVLVTVFRLKEPHLLVVFTLSGIISLYTAFKVMKRSGSK
ncbi:MAG: NRAMP family divalent metal transporter [Cyclobacteriaceae bacterium]|jgi:manganese transport protein|nr:divalent metal cation transporter [Flammeovirgaceae bacterium]